MRRYLEPLPITIPVTAFMSLMFYAAFMSYRHLLPQPPDDLILFSVIVLTTFAGIGIYGVTLFDLQPADMHSDNYVPMARDSITHVQNEMGVVAAFASMCSNMGYTITKIQVRFPDAIVYEAETGLYLNVEFEYESSSFRKHGHDVDKCDLLICWVHDWQDCPLPVIEMREKW